MNIYNSEKYIELLDIFINNNELLNELSGKTILLTGATGMIGSFLVDVIMRKNSFSQDEEKTKIIAIARNSATAMERFSKWGENDFLLFVPHDITKPLPQMELIPDYVIHAASSAHPKAYVTEPVNTVLANILGTQNLLNFIVNNNAGRFLLLSSVEVYGENRGDTEFFTEDYCGYINCNTLRAGYPESKRVSEALCQAYLHQYGADFSIIRLSRTYGPTMRLNDSKAAAQFILNGIKGEDIVLKSEGTQFFSYDHVYDAVSGILFALLRGKTGEAYNLGAPDSNITLRNLAGIIASLTGTKVVFQFPDSIEKAGFSVVTRGVVNADKLFNLGWKPYFSIESGIKETLEILKQVAV